MTPPSPRDRARRTARTPLRSLLTLLLAGVMTAPRAEVTEDTRARFNALEAQGVAVGEITLSINNIFDTSKPGENKSLYRFANRIHVTTRPSAIRSQLLFEPGDPIVAQNIEESERLLRSNPFIFDASIRVLRVEDGRADLLVETRDNWTLFPEISLSRSGGETRWTLGLEEDNILGTGSAVTVSRRRDDDRSSTNFAFSDRNVGRTWISLDLRYRDSDDGEARRFRVAQPFYSLQSRFSAGFDVFTEDREEPLFSRGSEIGRFRQDERGLNAWWGVSNGLVDGWTTRYRFGVVVSDNQFDVPEDEPPTPLIPDDRDLRYPVVSVQRVEDRFEKVQNFNQIMQTEDLFLGRSYSLSLGYAGTSLGADRSAFIVNAAGTTNYGDPAKSLLTLSGRVSGRLESGTVRNGRARIDARYVRRQSPRRSAFVGTRIELGKNLDVDRPITLGGRTGLRGYDRAFGNGDASALFTVEQRFFTDWFPWRLFRVGGAVFADVGRTWGEDVTGREDSRWLADVGVGLRLGNARGNNNTVFHLDFAKPLESGPDIDSGLQISFEAKRGF
ncbi:MAG: BamA/TamA family outer membrane protein [Pseudomonadota bacterium]